jgi:DNA-directed RNA polymerase subunit RPC12/RpoP
VSPVPPAATEPVPRCLQRVRCALCPTCGATLALADDAARVECAYCGEDALVERRLRTIEAELVPGTDPALVARAPAPFLPAHALTKGGRTVGQCPNCASPVEGNAEDPRGQGHFECTYCGTRSKVEARLAHDHHAPFEAAAFDADLAAFRATPSDGLEADLRARQRSARLADAPALWDELQDLHARRMLTATDEAALLGAVKAFEPWSVFTPWRELALARLMELACGLAHAPVPRKAAEQALVERVVERTAAAAWKYDERRRAYVRAIVRAAGRVLFAPKRSALLLDALGFAQPAAMLKLLLEAAEWALAHGHTDDARAALAAAGASLDFRRGQYHIWRDKVDRNVVGEVLLYRLLYLTPPLLAWALDQLPRWQVDDYARVGRFMDDCALERPELAPILLDAGIARPKNPQTFAEYDEHLTLVESLETPEARLFALRCRTFDPEGWDEGEDTAPLPDILQRLLALHVVPSLADEVAFELARFMAQLEHRDLAAVHRFARDKWRVLPEHTRAVYRRFALNVELPEIASKASTSPHMAAPPSAFASAVARHRGQVERDYEATRIEQDLDEARRGIRLTAAVSDRLMDPSSNEHYLASGRLHATWLAYRATRDPRFKALIAEHERLFTP